MKRSEGSRKFEEIVISIAPRRTRRDHVQESTGSSRPRHYDAVIYGRLPWSPPEPIRGFPERVEGLPLAAIETLTIRWTEYNEYLSWFLHSEKSPNLMRERLLEPLSPRLEEVVAGGAMTRPVRIWWNLRAPELEELPWELLIPQNTSPRISFARGTPGDLTPLVPVHGALRLAVIGADEGLDVLWNAAPPRLEVTRLAGSIRDGLRTACREGYHAVHVVARGSISRGFDSMLRLDAVDPDDPERTSTDTIAAPEIHATLNGANAAVLSVSASPAITHARAKSTFRAFAHLGGGERAKTTVVAPIGPMQRGRELDFWRELYATLAKTLSIEDALWAANQECSAPTPVALFLRHRLGTEFSRRTREVSASMSADIDPARLDAELRASREFLDRLAQLKRNPDGGSASSESIADARQSLESLDLQLDSWREPDGGDG